MRKITLIFLWLIAIGVHSQTTDFNNYKPLQSSGTLPKEFENSSTEKYNNKKAEIAKAPTSMERQAKNQYYLESAFALDDILKSGRILFNDTISNYLSAVMAKILENRETKKDVRVYCIKSAVVNAYTTGNGIVFVTTGLLARVRTEAQLAFILSHEYMHYVYKHSIKGYIESKKIVKGSGDYKQLNPEKKFLARQAFSREQESEADLKGFALYAKSDYSFEDVDSSFEVLKYYYLPFGHEQFQRSFVETGSFKIPDSYWLTDLAPIDPQAYDDAVNGKSKKVKDDEESDDNSDEEESDEDKASTHPSIEKRLDDLHDAISEQDKKGRKHFIVSEDAFYFIRKVARFELVRLNLLSHSYEGALYNSYNLLQEEPNSMYLKKCIAKALYGIAMYANTGNMAVIHVKKKYTQGEWQQVPNLVGKLKGEGVSVWAINYTWNLKKQYPEDVELKLIFNDLMKSVMKTYVKKKKDFVMKYGDTVAVATKYKKLKPFIRMGFLNLFETDPDFKTAYEKGYAKYIKEKKAVADDDEEVKSVKTKAKKEAKSTFDDDDDLEASKDDITIHWDDKLVKGNTKYIGDGKVMVLTPRFSSWTTTEYDEGRYNYIESEKGKEAMLNSLQHVLPRVMPGAEVINAPTSEEVERLNEISLLNDWVGEKTESGKLNMVAVDYERVQEVAAKHNADNLFLLSVSSIHQKQDRNTVSSLVIVSVILWPILPVTLYYLLRPVYYTNLYYISLNFKQDKIINATHSKIKSRATKSQLKSQLYAHLLNLKKI
jgi:hypothetical protein